MLSVCAWLVAVMASRAVAVRRKVDCFMVPGGADSSGKPVSNISRLTIRGPE
jgi:hypothetical protein